LRFIVFGGPLARRAGLSRPVGESVQPCVRHADWTIPDTDWPHGTVHWSRAVPYSDHGPCSRRTRRASYPP